MKKIVLLLLMFPVIVFSQERYRMDGETSMRVERRHHALRSVVIDVEHILNENWRYIDALSNNFTDPTEQINRIRQIREICISCYEAEFQSQLQRITDRRISDKPLAVLFHRESIADLANTIDSLFPIKRGVFLFENRQGATLRANLEFRIEERTTGGNRSLEIAGETTYSLRHISGRFLDIFPIWQKYFAPNTEPEDYFGDRRGNGIYNYRIFLENRTVLARLYSRGGGNNWFIEFSF